MGVFLEEALQVLLRCSVALGHGEPGTAPAVMDDPEHTAADAGRAPGGIAAEETRDGADGRIRF